MDECVKKIPFVCACVYRHVKIESKMVVTESGVGGVARISIV